MFGWLKLKLYAIFALIGAGLVAAIYVMGGKAEKNKTTAARLKGMKKAQQTEREIDDADRDTIIDINSR